MSFQPKLLNTANDLFGLYIDKDPEKWQVDEFTGLHPVFDSQDEVKAYLLRFVPISDSAQIKLVPIPDSPDFIPYVYYSSGMQSQVATRVHRLN